MASAETKGLTTPGGTSRLPLPRQRQRFLLLLHRIPIPAQRSRRRLSLRPPWHLTPPPPQPDQAIPRSPLPHRLSHRRTIAPSLRTRYWPSASKATRFADCMASKHFSPGTRGTAQPREPNSLRFERRPSAGAHVSPHESHSLPGMKMGRHDFLLLFLIVILVFPCSPLGGISA
jgi:hypothetical protein